MTLSDPCLTAKVYHQGGRLQMRCARCRRSLAEADTVREIDYGHKTLFIVACPTCRRFNSYYRRNQYERE